MRLHEYRVLRPLGLFGRIAGTGKRLRLPEAEARPLIESGHIAPRSRLYRQKWPLLRRYVELVAAAVLVWLAIATVALRAGLLTG